MSLRSIMILAALALPTAWAATLEIQLTGSNYSEATGIWTDTSGNGNHGTRNANSGIGSGTTNTGQTSVVFDGNDRIDLVDLSGFNGTGGEAFLVIKMDSNVYTSGDSGIGGMWNFGNNGAANHYTWTDGSVYDDFGSNTRHRGPDLEVFNGGKDLSVWHVYNVRSLSGEWTSLINNDQTFTTASNTVSFTTAPTLGAGGSFTLTGEIAEFRFYSGTMTGGERTAIYNSLNSTYIIPEPSAVLLAGLGSLLLLRRRC